MRIVNFIETDFSCILFWGKSKITVSYVYYFSPFKFPDSNRRPGFINRQINRSGLIKGWRFQNFNHVTIIKFTSQHNMKAKSKTIEIYILVITLAFLAVGALYGGISLMNDPSGESIKLPITFLEGTVFSNYLIPGVILFLALGFFPLFLLFPLLFKPNWPIINKLNVYKSYHWAWTYTLYSAIMLIIWIDVQVLILKTGSVIQGTFGLLGVFILILTLSPRVKRYYRLQNHSRQQINSTKWNEAKIFHESVMQCFENQKLRPTFAPLK